MGGGKTNSTPQDDQGLLNAILSQNRDLNWVQRLENPYIFPVINNDDDSYSTHRMAWDQLGDKAIVFPLIIQDPLTGGLQQLSPQDAKRYAVENNQFIPFNTDEQADWFTKNYKKTWEKKK